MPGRVSSFSLAISRQIHRGLDIINSVIKTKVPGETVLRNFIYIGFLFRCRVDASSRFLYLSLGSVDPGS